MSIAATRATTLSVGPFEISGPVAALISTGSGGTFSVDGLLGTGFLRRFKVTFDYSHQQIWFEPNGRPRDPQVFDASGIEVRPTEAHEFAIVAVAPDSPAAEANLRVGDVLKEIDGRRTRDMTLGDIQDAFSRAGVTCTVQMERGTHVDKATLPLRRRL
jgi:membrane-associated protease RseP (regulator of RpoE activity)